MEKMSILQLFSILFFMLIPDEMLSAIPTQLNSTIETKTLPIWRRIMIMNEAMSRFITYIENQGVWQDFQLKSLTDHNEEWVNLCLLVAGLQKPPPVQEPPVQEPPVQEPQVCTAEKFFNTPLSLGPKYTIKFSHSEQLIYNIQAHILKCECRRVNHPSEYTTTFFLTSFSDTEFLKLSRYSEILPASHENEFTLTITDFLSTNVIE